MADVRRVAFWVCLLLLLAAAELLADAGAAAEKLKAVAGGNVQPMDVNQYKVLRWVEDQQAKEAAQKWSLYPVEAAAIFQAGQQYIVHPNPI